VCTFFSMIINGMSKRPVGIQVASRRANRRYFTLCIKTKVALLVKLKNDASMRHEVKCVG
jgi:hypothetical protein